MKNPEALEHCAVEPIHLLERVQHYGAMGVFDATSGRQVASTPNFAALLGGPAADGADARAAPMSLHEVLQQATASAASRSRERIQQSSTALDWNARVAGRSLHFFRHRTPNTPPLEVIEVVVEAPEDEALSGEEVLAALAGFSQQLLPMTSLSAAMKFASDKLLSLLGYARALVYRFDEDMHGEVIAESWGPAASVQAPVYQGLRFPASDIPPQARRLYEKNLVRIIADASDAGWRLEHRPGPDGAAPCEVDLTHALLRRPSEMHLLYMRNMGVAASVVTSLMVEGRLWGMIVCQHEQPRVPPHNTRAIALGFCQVVSSIVSSKLRWIESQAALQRRLDEAAALEELEALLRARQDAPVQHLPIPALLQRATRSDDAWLLSDGGETAMDSRQWALLGQLLDICAERDHLVIAERDVLQSPPLQRLGGMLDACAGLAAYVSRGTPNMALVCLRRRQTVTVRWGGDPGAFTTVAQPDGTQVPGPRRSFAQWVEQNGERSEPWIPGELEFLERAGALVAKFLSEHRLRAVQSEYDFVASLLPLMDDMIVAWQPGPRPGAEAAVFMNDSFRHKLGLEPEQARYSQWVPPTMQRAAALADKGPQTATSVATDRVELVDGSGKPIWVDCSFTLIPASARNPALVSCVLRDVTETVEREQQLLEAKRTLESKVAERTAKLSSAMRELEGLSYSMAHDLRGPLRSINGFASLLCEELVEARDDRALFAQKISDSSRLMGQMISDLLVLIRVVNEEPMVERVDLPAVLTDMSDSLTAGNPDLQIELEAMPAVMGDARLLRQLFLNLLDNAIKYRRPDVGLRVRLGFDAQRESFYVSDNGSGFDRGAEGDPFQPFRRMRNANGVSGAGIGLTVVSRIVEKLQGTVAIESTPGVGTTVWLRLPHAGQAA